VDCTFVSFEIDRLSNSKAPVELRLSRSVDFEVHPI